MPKYLKSFLLKGRLEAGCDEAGRGCLAGPVVAAAVILPFNFKHKLLIDSKKLTHEDRQLARNVIHKHAISYAVGLLDNIVIDEVNILKSSFLAMHQAVAQLETKPDHLLIDGNRFIDYEGIEHTCIVKGDSKYASIAAASILAKTHRDELMQILHTEFPQYQWNQNKGYPTIKHRKAIAEFGPCSYHRMTFKLL
jgi:ribonuclease HII